MGKILEIDLSSHAYSIKTISKEIYLKYLGGRGLAGYFLKDFITLPWDNEKMPFLIFGGPLNATQAPTSGRVCMMSRSPLTDTVGDCSVGGKFGFMLKKTGLDGIIITGKSEDLIGIEINNDNIVFKSADYLKNKDISYICNTLGSDGASVATIGKAAHNSVYYANIMVDIHSAAGRNGLGLIWANKNLQYLKIQGDNKVSIYDVDELKKACEDLNRLIATSPVLLGEFGITNYGTGALYDLMCARRMMPTMNFRETYFKDATSMNAFTYKKKYKTKKNGCRGCSIQCKKISFSKQSIPEFETMSHFSALIDNSDIDVVMEANRICNESGMDTITAASTLASFSEIRGITLKSNEVLKLLNDIIDSKGDGELLKLGSYRYASLMNKSEISMSVKKLEIPAYDPRGSYGMALAYATSNRGACHLRAYPVSFEILRKPVAVDRFSFMGKARVIKIAEDLNAVIDSLTACKFLFFAVSLEEYAKALNAITGEKFTAQDLLKIGERIYYNERIMNFMNGFTSKDDDLPDRFFNESGSSSKELNIPAIDREDFLKTVKKYYKVRGLDDCGMPLKIKKEELGL